jgi:hypothetical protein
MAAHPLPEPAPPITRPSEPQPPGRPKAKPPVQRTVARPMQPLETSAQPKPSEVIRREAEREAVANMPTTVRPTEFT